MNVATQFTDMIWETMTGLVPLIVPVLAFILIFALLARWVLYEK